MSQYDGAYPSELPHQQRTRVDHVNPAELICII